MIDSKLKSFVINTLRRASYRYPARSAALKAARIERGQYTCNVCKGIFPNKEINLDHINPVVDPVLGFINFDIYIERMFVDVNGWQVLCDPCHDSKTEAERAIRQEHKQSVKKKKIKLTKKQRRATV